MAVLPPFQALLDEHGAAVWRFLRASLGEHDAADAYQETLLSALRAYPALRRSDHLKSWFFTIAHHKAIDHHRRVARRHEVDGSGVEPVTVEPEPVDEDLWHAVGRLPPQQQAAVLHRYVADPAPAPIAAILARRQ